MGLLVSQYLSLILLVLLLLSDFQHRLKNDLYATIQPLLVATKAIWKERGFLKKDHASILKCYGRILRNQFLNLCMLDHSWSFTSINVVHQALIMSFFWLPLPAPPPWLPLPASTNHSSGCLFRLHLPGYLFRFHQVIPLAPMVSFFWL